MWQGDGHYEDIHEKHIKNEKLVSAIVAEGSCFDKSNECQHKEYSLVNA